MKVQLFKKGERENAEEISNVPLYWTQKLTESEKIVIKELENSWSEKSKTNVTDD